MINVQKITSADWSFEVGAEGEIVEGLYDIEQCIQIILGTPKGSDPHRPEFGSDLFKYIDAPVNIAVPSIIQESVDAILIWEPRAELISVTPTIDNSQITLQVSWQLKGTSTVKNTEVTINGPS